MQRESISRQTFLKGIAAAVVVASSLGILNYSSYSTAAKAKKHSFVPGTYSSAARGMDGDVTVTITTDDSSITEVKADVSHETPGIGAEIGDEVQAQIMEAQSSAIDGVSGSTITTTAVKEALDAAIAKAEAGEMDAPEDTGTADSTGSAGEAETAGTEAAGLTQTAAKASAGAEAEMSEMTTEAAGEMDKTETAQEEPGQTTANAAGDNKAAAASSAGSAYVPGTYSSSEFGMASDVKVDVTVDESSVTDVQIDVSGETPNLGAAAGPELIRQFLEAQGAQIDGIAGVTLTSNAAKTAMEEALSQAAGGAQEAVTETETAEETVAETAMEAMTEAAQEAPAEESSEDAAGSGTTALTEGSEEADAKAKAENDSAEADTKAKAENDSAEAKAEITAEGTGSASAGYQPGTYTASAMGMESDVTVTITFSGSRMTAVGINVSGETAGYGAAAGAELTKQILKAQSDQIDGVSGATITSNAAKAAVKDCIAQASGK